MSKSVALGMLRQGQTGAQILEILNVLTAEIEQENIQDCADHYAAISENFEFWLTRINGESYYQSLPVLYAGHYSYFDSV